MKKKAAAKDNDLASPSSAKRKRYSEVVDANHEVDLTPDEDLDSSYTPSPRRNFAAAQLLNRPALATRPVSVVVPSCGALYLFPLFMLVFLPV